MGARTPGVGIGEDVPSALPGAISKRESADHAGEADGGAEPQCQGQDAEGGEGGAVASSSVKPRPAMTWWPSSGSRFWVTPRPFTLLGLLAPGAWSGALNGVSAAMSWNAVLPVSIDL
jgi:hypothetical protein